MTGYGVVPLCGHCKKPIKDYVYNASGIEMHEVIISRGMVSGSVFSWKIMVPENCLLVHSKCHGLVDTKEAEIQAIQTLINYETCESIILWLISLKDTYKIAGERLQWIQNLIREGELTCELT